MNLLDVIAKAQQFLTQLSRGTRKIIRNSLKWIHLLVVTGLLYLCPMQLLEAMIVVILMFEIGFEFSALDRLIELNNKIRTWMLHKFSVKRRKPPC
jgi:hypothetical protein